MKKYLGLVLVMLLSLTALMSGIFLISNISSLSPSDVEQTEQDPEPDDKVTDAATTNSFRVLSVILPSTSTFTYAGFTSGTQYQNSGFLLSRFGSGNYAIAKDNDYLKSYFYNVRQNGSAYLYNSHSETGGFTQWITNSVSGQLTAATVTSYYTFIGWFRDITTTSSGQSTTTVYKTTSSSSYNSGGMITFTGQTITFYAIYKQASSAGGSWSCYVYPNGGTYKGSSSTYQGYTKLYYGDKITLDTPVRNGYHLTSWSFNSTSAKGSISGSTVTVKSNSDDVKANWGANTYTINYNAGSGSGSMTSSSATYDTAFKLKSNTFSYTGHYFSGWKVTSGLVTSGNSPKYGSSSSPSSSVTTSTSISDGYYVLNLTNVNSGSVTLTAQWSASGYIVTLNPNGGIWPYGSNTSSSRSVLATYGSSMPTSFPSGTTWGMPTRSGYSFGGFYDTSSSSGGTQYYTSSGSSATTWDKTTEATLYARWTAISYTITLNQNNATTNGTTSTSADTSTSSVSILNPLRTGGWKFDGYATSSTSSTIVIRPDGTFVSGISGYTSSSGYWSGGAKTLYAHWSRGTYSVSLVEPPKTDPSASVINSNGTGNSGFVYDSDTGYWTSQNRGKSSSYSLAELSFTNKETVTLKFNVVSFGESNYDFGIFSTLDNTLTSTYTEDTGTVVKKSYKSEASASVKTLLYENIAPGSHFIYIKYRKDNSADRYDDRLQFNYAFYTSVVGSASVTYGSNYPTLTSPSAKSGYVFDGWYTAITGGTKVTTSTTSSTAGDHTLYAHWRLATFTITLNPNGGSGGTSSVVATVGSSSLGSTITNPSKAGYSFAGWTTTQNGSTVVINTSGNLVSGVTGYTDSSGKWIREQATTVWAKWNVNRYAVTLDPVISATQTHTTVYMDYAASTVYSASTGATTASPTASATGYTFKGWAKPTTGCSASSWALTGSTGYNYRITAGSAFEEGMFVRLKFTSPAKPTWIDINDYSIPISKLTNSGNNYTLLYYYDADHNNYLPQGYNFIDLQFAAQPSVSALTLDLYKPSQIYINASGKGAKNWDVAGAGTLGALFAANTYTINYASGVANNTGVTGSTTAQTATFGLVTQLRGNGFVRTGYSFGGWKVTAGLNTTTAKYGTSVTGVTNAVTSGTTLTNSCYVLDLSAIAGGSVTLTALWTPNSYTATINSGGGTHATNLIQGANSDWTVTNTGNMSIAYKASTGTYTLTSLRASDPWCSSNITADLQTSKTYVMSGTATTNGQFFWGIGKSYAETRHHDYSAGNFSFEFTVDTAGIYDFRFDNPDSGSVDHTNEVNTITNLVLYDKATLGTGNVTYSIKYDTYQQLVIPTRAGYTFKGWQATSGTTSGASVLGNVVRTGAGVVTFTAQWQAQASTVTLNANGGTLGATTSVSATYGQPMPGISSSNLPTYTGYKFDGFYDKTSDGTKYYNADGTSARTWDKVGAATLYAHWTAKTYTVNFNANSGTLGSTTSVTATFGQDLPKVDKANLPTRTGYNFVGFYDAASNGVQYYKLDSSGNAISARAWNKDGSDTYTLWAHWEAITYTITYNAAGGSVSQQTQPYNIEDAITLLTPTRTGYNFTGWTPDNSGNWGKTTLTSTSVSKGKYGNVTLTATWTEKTFSVALKKNDGTDTTVETVANVTYNKAMPGTHTATRTAYTFQGYFDKTTDGTKYYNADGSSAHVWDKDGTQGQTFTLYAQWKPTDYTITYSVNGGTALSGTYTTSYTIEKSITLPSTTKSGYDFSGWKPNSSTSHNWGTSIYKTSVDAGKYGDVTLTAQWTAAKYTLTYDWNIASMPRPDLKNYAANTYDDTGIKINWSQSFMLATSITTPASFTGRYLILGNYQKDDSTAFSVEIGGGTNAGKLRIYLGSGSINAYSDTALKTGTNYYVIFTWNAQNKAYTLTAGDITMKGTCTGVSGTATNSIRVGAADNRGTATFSAISAGMPQYIYTTSATPYSNTATYNSKYPTFPTLESNAYTFSQWSSTANGASGSPITTDTTYSTAGNSTVYARWTSKAFTVTLNQKSGSNGSESVEASFGQDMPAAIMPTRTGYSFQGYYDVDGATGGVQYYTATGTSARKWDKSSAATLYARWSANEYTIKYDLQGGNHGATHPDSAKFDTAFNLTNPTKTGYDFSGWSISNGNMTTAQFSTDNSSWTKWTAATTITKATHFKNLRADTAEVTLTANWQAHTYTISFSSNGGSGEIAVQNATYGTALKLSKNTFSYPGYRFVGWKATSGLDENVAKYGATETPSTKLTADSVIDDEYYVLNLTPVASGKITLTAQWTEASFTVKLDANQGTLGSTQQVTATYNKAMPTISESTLPTRTGYAFTGFFDATEGGTKYYEADGTSAHIWDKTSGTTLYAQWEANGYTVTLNANGGDGGDTSIIAKYAQPMPSAKMPTRTGYTFLGYFDDISEGKQYYSAAGTSANDWDKTLVSSTLWAHWSADSHTLHVNTNGATEADPFDVTLTTDQTYTLPSYTRTGYTFGSWELSQPDNKTQLLTKLVDGVITMGAGDATVTAKWTPLTFEVTLDENYVGGKTTKVTAVFDSLLENITPPTRENFIFLGYYDEKSGGTQYYQANGNGSKAWDKTTAATLWAHWQEKTWDDYTEAFTGGGTQSNPYIIDAPEKLAYLAKQSRNITTYAGTYFKLTANLDMSAHVWLGIGSRSQYFTGNFDGNWKVIYGIKTIGENVESEAYGLFNELGKGTIKNLYFKDSEIAYSSDNDLYIGGLVGSVYGGTITNVQLDNVTVSGENASGLGGIVGYIDSGTLTSSAIRNSNITGGGVGGIVYKTSGVLKDCFGLNLTLVETKGAETGIVCASGDISACYAFGTINGVETKQMYGDSSAWTNWSQVDGVNESYPTPYPLYHSGSIGDSAKVYNWLKEHEFTIV